MDKKFVTRVILLPLLTGLVLSGAFTVFMSSRLDNMLPFSKGAVIALHDSVAEEPGAAVEETGDWRFSELENNTLIGTAGDLSLRYNADYSLMAGTASVMPGSAEWGQPGCLYLKILAKEALNFGDSVTVSVPSYGDRHFEYVEEYTVSGEQAALSAAPAYDGSMVIYYRITGGIGLTPDYGVMVYREVA